MEKTSETVRAWSDGPVILVVGRTTSTAPEEGGRWTTVPVRDRYRICHRGEQGWVSGFGGCTVR